MSNIKPYIRKDKDYIEKAQNFCKILRADICNLTLKQMADIYNLNMKNLSAWENGRSNKADYLFYYYDLCNNETTQRSFIDVVFNSDGKDIVINTTKNLENRDTTYLISFTDRK